MAQTGEFNEPTKITSPWGEEFDLIGPAGPVRFKKAPGILAEAGGDLLVIKEGALFLCSRKNGDITPSHVTGQGLYTQDTRFLSEFLLTIGDVPPILLSSSADLAYAMVVDMTNPNLRHNKEVKVAQQTLSLRRFRLIGDRLYERIHLRNFGESSVNTTLQLSLGADFADMFEIRGVPRKSRGDLLASKRTERGLNFAYVGADKVFRETIVEWDPKPHTLDIGEGHAAGVWEVELAPHESFEIMVSVEPSVAGKRRRARSLANAERQVLKSHNNWRTAGTEVQSDNELFDGFVGAAVRDLRALVTPWNSSEMLAAGIPWYVAPFGRDSLLTCYEVLMFNPALAKQTLKFLARHQSKVDDPWRDAEPGKILHEIRTGELAKAGLIPHTPYYGSVDSTPLFLLLAAAYFRWTNDLTTLAELLPNLNAALGWIANFGDADGDGFVEYQKRSASGLVNQGWKDSDDSIVHLDGSIPEGPIALVEVQGYVHLAKRRIADVYEALGMPEMAESLKAEAKDLKEAFNEAFWMPNEGMFAVALDGQKRQVRSITSNPGHCLYCDIIDPDKAGPVAERLMAPDMFSGWGVRTLSSESVAYNPMSYHNGSVWPHDNAIVAAGLKRYGFADATETIATALFHAAEINREIRLPELFCGFNRRDGIPFVSYPVACSPQAWASGVPFVLLQSLLGVSANAPESMLTINKPRLPSWLRRLEMNGVTVGESKLSFSFSRDREKTSFSLTEREGFLRVMIEE
ncbi:MAG: amylo-alpha-1,6-glucosidase [Actinomycetota bacterium]